MRILYDHQIFERQRFGGISRYFCHLIGHLRRRPDVVCLLRVRFSENRHLSGMGLRATSAARDFDSFVSGLSFRGKWRLYRLRNLLFPLRDPSRANVTGQVRALRRGAFDVFHPTYYDDYFVRRLGARPYVLTVYDMIHERFPHLFPRDDPTAARKSALARGAAHVICISEATRRDLLDVTGIAAARTSVIHLGTPESPLAEPEPVRGLLPGYLLYVGARAGYKNFPFLVEAIAPLIAGSTTLRLVCVGPPFDEEELGFLKRHGVASHVVAVTASEAELAWLYRNAACVVVPSLYEGFGLTLLEAFANDCPVACSRAGSLPEVAGDAAVYFDPTDHVSANDAIARVLEGSDLRGEMRAKGRGRAAQFSWEATATRTLAVYRQVVS